MIKSRADLETKLHLTDREKAWFDNPSGLPLLISRPLFDLIDPDDVNDPVRKQFVPDVRENDKSASLDPLAETEHSVSKRIIHRYEHRIAFLTTDRCFSYCRHCFRRRFTAKESSAVTEREIDEAASYLEAHEEVYEVLLTGGDMFTLSDRMIEYMLSTLRRKRKDLVLRLCTRANISFPQRFTPELMQIIKKANEEGPLYLMTHYNHPAELTPESLASVKAFTRLGIACFNQTVLLRGVNDNADTLEKLCVRLLASRIKPYYLFQCDLVEGTAHLRVPVAKGLEIEKELRKRLSGLAMPQYTIDLPEGGGKVILTEQHLISKDDETCTFTTPEGEIRHYPAK